MKTPIRVLQLIDGLNIGGAEVLLKDLSAGLLKHGFDVGVGYSTPGPILNDLQSIGITPVRLPKLARIDPILYGSSLLRLIRTYRPQIVHTHLFKSDFHGRVAAAICRVPVVISTLHNNDPWARQWLYGRLYGLTARFATRLIAVAPEVKEYHAKFSHIPAENITTILNGVDVDRFKADPAASIRLRREFGLSDSDTLVGIIGRLKPQKDHVTFLRAVAEILHSLPQARFLVVGDGPLRAELETLAQSLGISHAVHFCGLRSDIPAILSSLDLLVMSSQWEGLPITLLEGMAASRAIVTTAVPGILDVVEPETTAVTVPPADPASLARACIELLNNPQKCRNLGDNALQSVRQRFSIQAMIEQTVQVYRTALAQRSISSQKESSADR